MTPDEVLSLTNMSESLLTTTDLQKLFRVGDRTLRRWIVNGKLPPPIRIGGVRRWKAHAIREMLKELD